MRRLLIASLCLLAACSSAPAPEATQPPARPAGCKTPQVFASVPGYTPIYADRGPGGAYSEVDPAAYAAMKQRMEAFWNDLNAWLAMSNAVAAGKPGTQSACAIRWLEDWAAGAHMLSPPKDADVAAQYQSRYEMKWALQGIATAYALVLRREATPAQHARIAPWLRAAGREVAAFNIERPGDGKLNNHYYWGGAAAMAAGVATDDADLIRLARRTYEAGIDSIAADGSLPRERTRRQQALHYHGYSLTPLTLMAELARLRGEDWYAYKPEQLPKLVAVVTRGMRDPAWGADFFGTPQSAELIKTCSDNRAWSIFWRKRDPDGIGPLAPPPGECSYRSLGGDLAMLMQRGYFRGR
ncbi:alginate lyase family protein [Viridibacterium curvum]|uniref:Alginate lyase domain-containing protein n=1 Tax=Viridibacterium curvum TaxID=1101404 RepID=A0ABP9QGJ1_9RHOO